MRKFVIWQGLVGFGSLIRGQNLKTNTNFIKKRKKRKRGRMKHKSLSETLYIAEETKTKTQIHRGKLL